MLASTTAQTGAPVGIQAGTFQLSLSQRVATAVFAGLLGFSLLYVTAFANADVLHNAAHDVRHAIVAPCH